MSKPYILIVEDDAWLGEHQVEVLKAAGFDARLAPHAPAAIVMVDQQPPAAIVLDVLLTASTGFALLHELQSYGDTGEIPIILCTNIAESLKLDDLKSYGVKRIIDKTTMVPEDVVAAVRSVL
jgi:CheY-like chemotaxis protein